MIWLFLDSYHDRRTGYEFGVNPSGVKLDAQIYNDGNEDFAWDAVWEVATRADSLAWTDDFRIRLSQLRYGRERSHTFGLTVDRDLYRYSQRVSWPLFRQSKAGFVSQFGEITGLDDLEAPRRLEVAPYVVTKNVSEFTSTGLGRTQDVAAGGDLKYRVASNLTLDATFNPDFGQVEADPGVLNLSAFETFFSERRPFFVAGRGLFQFDVNCTAVNDCGTGEGLVYSRRIGRAPQLAGSYSDTTSPAFTRILGAGKLTGRLPGGLTIGALDAVTQHVTGVGGVTIEPTTNYGELQIGRVAGAPLRAQPSSQRRSAGFEIKPLGSRRRADQQVWSTWVGYFDRHTRRLYQRFQWNFNWWQYWTTAGLPEERAFNTNTHTTFNNTWSFHTGFTLGQLGETYCYSCARGGPAVRQDPYLAPWAGVIGDDRKAIVPYFWVNYWRGDGGRSRSLNLSPELDFKVASRVTASIAPNYTRTSNAVQPLGPVTDTTIVPHVTRYVVAHPEQKQPGVTMRFTYPFTASATLQVYAQPFVSKGTYSNVQH